MTLLLGVNNKIKRHMKIKLTNNQIGRLIKEGLDNEPQTLLKEATLSAPLPGTLSVNSKFSKRRCLRGPSSCRAHNGTDYKARSGTQALAIADGTVSKVKPNQGRCGGTIIIKHSNGYKSSYCHMKRITVKKGDSVKQGQLIGYTGGGSKDYGRGNSMGAHLHFGLRLNGKWVDPEKYIDKSNVLAGGTETRPEGMIAQFGDGLDGPISQEVKDIQQKLEDLNYLLPRHGVDGKFGPETQATVEAFQEDHLNTVTGVVDKETFAALQDAKNVNLKPQRNDLTKVKIKSKGGDMGKFGPTVVEALNKAAEKHSLPKSILFTIANIESGGNPGAINKRSRASGLFQILPRYFKSYGVTNTSVWDPYVNADVAAAKLKEKFTELTTFLGRPPSAYELYLAHNQGTLGFKVIRTACTTYGEVATSKEGKHNLQKAAVSLGYNKRTGGKIYRNMIGNKGDTPCKFLRGWEELYTSKQISPSQFA